MEHEKTIDVLSKLVEINNYRIEGYKTAAEEINEEDLKSLFFQIFQISVSCKEELSNEINKMGGMPTEGKKNDDNLLQAWLEAKAALAAKDFKAFLSSCEFGEDQAIKEYRNVLKDDLKHLKLAQQSIIKNQYSLIQSSHNTVKFMRKVFAESSSSFSV